MKSSHFTVAELISSATAVKKGIVNVPNAEQLIRIKNTIVQLEKMRKILNNNHVCISSGFRSKTLNDFVGGVRNSAHLNGDAVDFVVPGIDSLQTVFVKIAKSELKFDQLILYPTFVHISFAETTRMQLFKCIKNGKIKKYVSLSISSL